MQRVVVRVEVHRCRSDIAPAPGLPRWWPPSATPCYSRSPCAIPKPSSASSAPPGNGRDVDAILAWFAADAVYHNMPIAPVRGHSETRGVLDTFVPPASKIEFEILAVASRGDVVFTERVDRFVVDGKEIALPVAGVFEVRDGKIAAWRDYFDMASYQRQLS